MFRYNSFDASTATIAGAASDAVMCSDSSGPCISYQNASSGSSANYQSASGFGSRGSSQLGHANGVYAQTTSLGTKKTTSARTGAIVASDPSEGDNYGGGTYESYNAGLVASSQNGAGMVARLGGGSFQSDTIAYPNGVGLIVEMAYGARTTAPTMEDAGEAQLANGSATVRLDAALADVIDHRKSYLVFVTPEGDCKGLYVTAKTATTFAVRELQGGRSTLAFQYRILAKPVDDDSRPLASLPPQSAEPRRSLSASGTTQRVSSARSLTPLEQLQKRLGPAGYAKEMREYVRQQNAR